MHVIKTLRFIKIMPKKRQKAYIEAESLYLKLKT